MSSERTAEETAKPSDRCDTPYSLRTSMGFCQRSGQAIAVARCNGYDLRRGAGKARCIARNPDRLRSRSGLSGPRRAIGGSVVRRPRRCSSNSG